MTRSNRARTLVAVEYVGPKRRATRRRKRPRSRAGISLVESAALISLAGVLLAAFIPTFTRHLRASKMSEAVDRLGFLYRGTAAYYVQERTVDGKLIRQCLPESLGPLPAEPSAEAQWVDFDDPETPQAEAWRALGDTTPLSLRYSYEVLVAQSGCGLRNNTTEPNVVFKARGDLDGDGVLSEISRAAQISAEAPYQLEAVPPLSIRQRVE